MSTEQKEPIFHAPNIGTSVPRDLDAHHAHKEKAHSVASVSRPTTPDGSDSPQETSIRERSRQEDPVVSTSGTDTDDDTRSDTSTDSSSCLVIVNYVPDSWTEARLRHQFKPFNPTSVKLVMDRHTGKTQGYGFVQFRSPEDTSRAIASLNGLPVSGKRLKVTLAKPREEAKLNTNIYVSGLPPDPYCTDVYLHGLCSTHGTVLELKLLREAAIRGSHQTLSAFVRFRRRQESDNAIGKLNGAVVQPPGTDRTWTLSARYATDARTRSKETAGVWVSDSLGRTRRHSSDRSHGRRTHGDDRPRLRPHHNHERGRRTHNRPVNPWHTPPTIGNVAVDKVKDTVTNVGMEEPDFVTPLKPTRSRTNDGGTDTGQMNKQGGYQSASAPYRERDVPLLSSSGPPSITTGYTQSHRPSHRSNHHALSLTEISPDSSVWSTTGSQHSSTRWTSAISSADTGFYPTPPTQTLPPMSFPLDVPLHSTYPLYPSRHFQDAPHQYRSQVQQGEYSSEFNQNRPPVGVPSLQSGYHGTVGAFYPPYPPEGQQQPPPQQRQQQQYVPFSEIDRTQNTFHADASATTRRHYSSFSVSPLTDTLAPVTQTPGLPTQSAPFPITGPSAFPTSTYPDHNRPSLWENRFGEGEYNPEWSLDPLGSSTFGSFVSEKLHTSTVDGIKTDNSKGDEVNDLDSTFDLDALLSELPLDSEDVNSPKSNKIDVPNQVWNTSI